MEILTVLFLQIYSYIFAVVVEIESYLYSIVLSDSLFYYFNIITYYFINIMGEVESFLYYIGLPDYLIKIINFITYYINIIMVETESYLNTIILPDYLISLINVIFVLLPVLLSVAFMTIIERKQLAAHQRRVGPNTVGIYGVLQPFADALKLILKENVIPSQSNKLIFYLAPAASLFCSLLGWAIIPFGPGLALFDFALGILFTLALSSLSIYGILFAGWSANSKYAFLGSLRSTAAMISYELVLSSAILILILLTGTLNLTAIIQFQEGIWLIFPLLPVFLIFFLSILAETSRTPFDLQEAESELVGGFFTEHSSVPFVFFFLAEYSSIVLFSCLSAIFFLGGYNLPSFLTDLLPVSVTDFLINISSIVLGVKTCIFCFFFVWFRATLPRLRYDQLMEVCWMYVLPVVVGFILFYPCLFLGLGLLF
jgi:NADH-ubiquinone oxidoreductase chain 1